MDDVTRERMRDALIAAGLSPDTVPLDALGEGQNGSMGEEETSPISLMRRRVSFTALTPTEIEALNEVFVTAGQARVPGSVILNGLVAHACGVAWENITEAQAVRMRLRRSAKRGEMQAVAAYVTQRRDVFEPERVEVFRRIAQLEADLRRRNGWS